MADLIPRHLTGLAREALATFPAIVIQGARQVGKSTFADIVTADRPHAHISLDDREVRTAAQQDPRTIAELMPEGTVIIDEIQRDLDLILAVKSSIDTNRRPGRFVLTGSSDLLRLAHTPDSLSGRAVTVELRGLSQGELSGRPDDFASWLRAGFDAGTVGTTWTRDDYVRALAVGGFPEVRTLSPRMRDLWLDSYVHSVLSRTIGDVSRGLSTDRLAAVWRLIAANPAGELVAARLAGQLGMPKSSIAAYLEALRTMYLTEDLPPWNASLTAREVNRHTVSVADSAVAMHLERLSPESLTGVAGLTRGLVLGGLLEAFVVGELRKQAGWSEQQYELYHFRDSSGLEVDLVLEYADGMAVLIEVKAASTYGSDQTAGIRALAKRLGDRFLCGVVLGTSARGHVLGDRLVGLPIATLWEQPGVGGQAGAESRGAVADQAVASTHR